MTKFIWDPGKEAENILKHGVDFETAQMAFDDPNRRITHDLKHSRDENRFFCVGKVADKVLMVRFTYRGSDIRIIGAGYWRKGKNFYEKKKKKGN
jgi:uncharacterized protein